MTNQLNKKAVNWLSASHFTVDIYSGFINPIMPFIAAKIGISMAIATVVISISQLFSSLLQPIFGFFADNIYKRAFIFWGLLFTAVFFPLCGITHNVWTLTLCVILGSLGVSIFHPQAMGFIIRFSDTNFSANMALFLSLGTTGYAFGSAVSSFITQFFGLEKMPFIAIFGVILALLMFKFVPKISLTDKKAPEDYINFNKAFVEIFKNTQIRMLLVISVMKALISTSCSVLLPFLWKDLGHSAIYIGIAIFLFLFAGGLGSFTSPSLEKIIGSKRIIYISMIMVFPLMILFLAFYKTVPLLSLLFFVLMAYSLMLASPVTMVLAQKTLPQYKSIIGGIINGFCWGIAGILMSALGFIAQHFGIPHVLVTLTLISALSVFFLKNLKCDTHLD